MISKFGDNPITVIDALLFLGNAFIFAMRLCLHCSYQVLSEPWRDVKLHSKDLFNCSLNVFLCFKALGFQGVWFGRVGPHDMIYNYFRIASVLGRVIVVAVCLFALTVSAGRQVA